ncbi:hypothetical protein VNI00_016167 [Paramarasmius palmivorus]|uniref:Uncharacterized protein n=1 Tax=Paramarasmius palmivorus TaxID=297713 RepID=A0AAW0BFG4_9AGAR
MLLLYALARPIASSLSASSTDNSTSFDPVTGKCIDINGCRTTTGILWSCLSVIFICTWVAIHPNIPLVEKFDHGNDRWTGDRWHPAVAVYQNVELMVVALLAPEFMILWAMRQREKAKKIGEQFKDYGWGMSHGFFMVMGGFALYDGEDFWGYLEESEYCGYSLWDKVTEYHQHMKAAPGYKLQQASQSPSLYPAASAPDEDRPATSEKPSKPIDKPSRDLCLLEFFVANRYITLTEDEIKDRSHADVITKSIAVIQTIWFIMQVIARAVEGLAITELEIITVGFAILNFGTYFLWWNKPLRVRHPVRVYWRQTETSGAGGAGGGEGGIWTTCWEGVGAIVEYIYADKLFMIFGRPHNTLIRLLLLSLWIPWHIFYVCLEILKDEDDSDLAIPISSRLDDDPLHLYIAVYGIAALFGAIHCIPWVFQFPTHTEQLLWRISAVAVAAAPVAMGLLHVYLKELVRSTPNWLDNVMVTLLVVLSLAYAVFRITLLVIAFTALRDLRPSAYQTVQWTTFIPHIG